MNYTRNGNGRQNVLLQYLSRMAFLLELKQHRGIMCFVHDPISLNAERPIWETLVQ